jgi:hypothetical protein
MEGAIGIHDGSVQQHGQAIARVQAIPLIAKRHLDPSGQDPHLLMHGEIAQAGLVGHAGPAGNSTSTI